MRGFTLVELAIVLMIVAVLVGGLLVPLSAQIDMRNTTETEKTLADVREALSGYAASHWANPDLKPYLPCPDVNDDGIEDRRGSPTFDCHDGAAAIAEGRIPWVTLGLGRNDAWNNRLRYRVRQAFSDGRNGFDLSTAGNVDICADSACATLLADDMAAVIISHGKNGAGAFNTSGGTNPLPAGADELENADNADNKFVSRTPGPDFDDLVVWIPPNILFNRMIAAGRLP